MPPPPPIAPPPIPLPFIAPIAPIPIADSSGLDAGLIARLLKSDADRDEIVEQDAAARGMGVSAVPTFIVASQHAVPGAQPPELWQKVIDELAAGADPAA